MEMHNLQVILTLLRTEIQIVMKRKKQEKKEEGREKRRETKRNKRRRICPKFHLGHFRRHLLLLIARVINRQRYIMRNKVGCLVFKELINQISLNRWKMMIQIGIDITRKNELMIYLIKSWIKVSCLENFNLQKNVSIINDFGIEKMRLNIYVEISLRQILKI